MGKDTPRFPGGASTDQVVREVSTELGFSRPYGFGDRQAPYENLTDFRCVRPSEECLQLGMSIYPLFEVVKGVHLALLPAVLLHPT